MSENLKSVFNVIERSCDSNYMITSSEDKYIKIPDRNYENRNSFEDYKK
jgi:hypothetical protein